MRGPPYVKEDRQMKILTPILALTTLFVASVGFVVQAKAFNLDGAWTTQADACKKIFAKTGNTTSFTTDAESYGSGFIVEGNSIRGQAAKCTIKARKEAGTMTHLIAICSTGIMIDQMQLSFKVDGDNRITRLFPGMEGFETSYVRCSFGEAK